MESGLAAYRVFWRDDGTFEMVANPVEQQTHKEVVLANTHQAFEWRKKWYPTHLTYSSEDALKAERVKITDGIRRREQELETLRIKLAKLQGTPANEENRNNQSTQR